MHKLREGRQLSVSNSEVVSDSEKSANESPHGAKATSDDEKFSPKENGDMYEEELWPEVTSSKRKQLIYSDDEEEDINVKKNISDK